MPAWKVIILPDNLSFEFSKLRLKNSQSKAIAILAEKYNTNTHLVARRLGLWG